MNDSNGFDPGLEHLFRQTHSQIGAEPFVRRTLSALATRRSRVALVKRGLQGAALAAVIVASPWLIEGSVWLSGALDAAFTFGADWLGSPIGMAAGGMLAVLVLALRRWQR